MGNIFQQPWSLFLRTALEVKDICGKVAGGCFLPATHAIVQVLLLGICGLGGYVVGMPLLFMSPRGITTDDFDLANRSSQCFFGTIVQMSLLFWGRLYVGFLSLDTRIGPLRLPLLVQSRGEGGVADGRVGNIGVRSQGHASSGHVERGRGGGGGIGGGRGR